MPEVHDFAPRYNGRLIVVEVYVNSDEDPAKVAKRVRNAARGQKLNAAACVVKLYEGEVAREVWGEIAKMGAAAVADPKSTPFDDAKDD